MPLSEKISGLPMTGSLLPINNTCLFDSPLTSLFLRWFFYKCHIWFRYVGHKKMLSFSLCWCKYEATVEFFPNKIENDDSECSHFLHCKQRIRYFTRTDNWDNLLERAWKPLDPLRVIRQNNFFFLQNFPRKNDER